jgi:sulfonate transport system permease protein
LKEAAMSAPLTLPQRRAGRLGHAYASAAPWLVPVVLLIVWQLASQFGWLSNRILPAPFDVVKAAWGLAVTGELWRHVWVSTWRAVLGFTIGGGFGLALGLLTGTFRPAATMLDSTLQMVRNIPPLALIPLVILWFGIDETAKLFLVSLGVFFPIYLNTYHGIRAVDPGLIEMAKSYGLSGWRLYREVILPGALPNILVGVRFSLGLMWVILIVAGGHPALRAAGQAGRLAVARPGTLLAALASRLPRALSPRPKENMKCKATRSNRPHSRRYRPAMPATDWRCVCNRW